MTDFYSSLFQELLLPAWESGVRRRPTLAHRRWLERTQWRSADELMALQSSALGDLLRHAAQHVPYYGDRFREAGVAPDDIGSVEDIGKLPHLTREDALRSFDERGSTAPPRPEIFKMTSGSTGRPLSFAYDRGSEYWRAATRLRGYGWAGYQPGDRSFHFWGRLDSLHQLPAGARAKAAVDHALRREVYVNCADHSPEALSRAVEILRRQRPTVVLCYARSGAALARHIVETGARDWDDIPVICGAERLFPADRAVLAEAFGPGIFETYGDREVMLIAAECEAHQGMHVSMENLVVELLVREDGRTRPALPGETGEVAVTDLHNYGMPFIRYLTGDLAQALPPGRCACGRSLSRLSAIEGRTSETIYDAQGRPVSGMMFSVLFSVLADQVSGFQVVQRRDRSLDLDLVPARGFNDAVLQLVRRDISKFVPGVELRLHVVPEIAASASGKRSVVRVERDEAG